MKKYIALMLLTVSVLPLGAQSRREALLEYQARRREAYIEFRANYRQAYADFMRRRWEAFRMEAPVPVPERQEPDQPVVRDPDSPVASTPVRIPGRESVATPHDRPAQGSVPADPAVGTTPNGDVPEVESGRSCRFTFYGTECSVSLTPSLLIRLATLQENSVADAWERIAGGSYDRAAGECLELKRQLRLNDWGYYRLVQTIGNAFCGQDTDESVLVQAFLMAEAGYKIRLARGDNRLRLLLALDQEVYERPYFKIDGQRFFLLDGIARAKSYNICNFSIAGERILSLTMPEPPLLAVKPGREVIHDDLAHELHTVVSVNDNLIDFLADYPFCYWDIYAATRLSDRVRGQLLPTLRRVLQGKSEREAAGILLSYLHNAFPYKTDEAQFGRERTLFCEEMFHYSYSDCEDRSILYVELVRELLGLKTVLLYYPNHIATAICFREQTAGDYVQVGSERYTVCDPTYIGAEVGECMPDLKTVSARIIRID